jgi:spermine oxidase
VNVESKVQLGKEVKNINWSGETIAIACVDGSSYLADHVIFTASLGVLKDRHATLFTPKLPENKVKAIETIGFGALGKVFLEFEKPFWPVSDEESLGFSFLWTEEDIKAVKGTAREW